VSQQQQEYIGSLPISWFGALLLVFVFIRYGIFVSQMPTDTFHLSEALLGPYFEKGQTKLCPSEK
jgi:uncharacterized membrane protein YqhA